MLKVYHYFSTAAVRNFFGQSYALSYERHANMTCKCQQKISLIVKFLNQFPCEKRVYGNGWEEEVEGGSAEGGGKMTNGGCEHVNVEEKYKWNTAR